MERSKLFEHIVLMIKTRGETLLRRARNPIVEMLSKDDPSLQRGCNDKGKLSKRSVSYLDSLSERGARAISFFACLAKLFCTRARQDDWPAFREAEDIQSVGLDRQLSWTCS